MAKLSNDIIAQVFFFTKTVLEGMDEATKLEYIIFELYGETDETLSELNELQNTRERADFYYSRFHVVLRRIYESQPVASRANLELLAETLKTGQANTEAIQASLHEIKRNWNLT